MKKVLAIIIITLVVFLVSCGSASYEVISASEAKIMLDNDQSIKLIDVREKSEYDDGHIEGAILLPLGLIQENAESILTNKSAPYILYCRSGNRSNQASQIFIDLGYKNIYDMGGIIDWPYEIIT